MQDKYNYYEIKPSQRLNDCIQAYWVMTDIAVNKTLTVFPDGCFDMVMYINENDDNTIFITGLWDKNIEVNLYKNANVVGVRFYPISVDLLFDNTLRELKNTKTEFSTSILKQSKDIDLSILYDLKNIEEIIAFYNFYFEHILEGEDYGSIFEYISFISAQQRVKDVADIMRVSTRQLLREHKNKLGITTKNYINIIRFIKAKAMLMDGENLSDIVFDCGYFDESHFIKEFKRYTSYTPKDFLKHVRFIQ